VVDVGDDRDVAQVGADGAGGGRGGDWSGGVGHGDAVLLIDGTADCPMDVDGSAVDASARVHSAP